MEPLRTHLLSDVHLEFHRDGGFGFLKTLPVAADTLVVAGDLAVFRHLGNVRKYFELLCQSRKRVLYTFGNHEYYSSIPREVEAMVAVVEKELPALKVLCPGRVETWEGRRFLGATLWFRDDPFNPMYAEQLNDFNLIKKFVPWVYEQNAAAVAFFEKELSPGDILVIHHLPSVKSVHPQYKNSSLNRFFLCDIENLILDRQPSLVIHGHSHSASDYFLGETRVVCNPLGYPGESSNSSFNDKMIVEV